MAHYDLRRPQKPLWGHNWEFQSKINQLIMNFLLEFQGDPIECYQTKNPTYTFIQTYTFVNFQRKVPPIRLFPPILIIIFKKISHLYFYSEPSSIRNSRVGFLQYKLETRTKHFDGQCKLDIFWKMILISKQSLISSEYTLPRSDSEWPFDQA